MPLISTFGAAGAQAFGTRGLQVGGSAEFNAIGDRFSLPQSTAFNYGTGNFTIEGWIYPTANNITRIIWNQDNGIYLCTIDGGQLYWATGAGNYALAAAPNLFAWNHVAVVRSAGSVRIFLNGVRYAAAASTNSIGTPTTVGAPALGNRLAAGNNQFLGYITNFRISKQALYTTNFTPSLVPFSRTSQNSSTTSLLLNMSSASTLSTDSSATASSVINTGVAFSTLTPYLQPYVTPPTVVVSSATVTPTTVTPSEGQTITVNVVGTNTANGTYYYSLQEELGTGALTASDFTSNSLTGSFTISGGVGSFPITVTSDLLTEGNEVFTIYVRTTSTSGLIIGTSAEITITDTSLTPTLSPSAGSVDEGNSVAFTASNVGPDGTYFWTILNGTTANADFGAVSGSFLVSGSSGGIDNGFGIFNIDTVADRLTEGNQTFQVQVRSGSTSGTVVVTSSSVTITDTSLTPSASFINSPNIAELSGNFGGLSTSTTLRVSNLGSAGTYYWSTIDNSGTLATTDLVGGSLTGSFTTSTLNGSADIVFTAAPDTVAEPNGFNAFQVQIREGSTTGTVLTTSGSSIVIYNSSVVISAINPNPISEGNAFNITLSTDLNTSTGIAPGTYFLTFESTGSATAADVSGLPYAVNVSGQGNYFINGVVAIVTLDGAETFETFKIGVRQGSTTGPLVGLSNTITINSSVT